MRWDISPRWGVSPEWDSFHSTFIWEKYPTWVRHFSSHLSCMPTFNTFIVYLSFSFYFNFRLLVRFSITNFISWIALFHRIIIKNPESTLNEQFCLGGTARQKLFTWRKIIPPKWDLIYVEVISHLGGTNQFSYKRFVFTKQNIPFCRDLTQMRRLTWLGWLMTYKQLLKDILKRPYKFFILKIIVDSFSIEFTLNKYYKTIVILCPSR